jgi:hypothetical protein
MSHGPLDVTTRLDRLEAANRVWRRLAVASWILLGAVGVLGQAAAPPGRPAVPAHVVEAERFVLRDSTGRIGATLGWERDDVRLALHDPAGRPRVVLALGGGPGLSLLDPDGRTVRAALVIGPDGAPGLALFDSSGKPRLAAALFHGRAGAGAGAPREPAPAVAAYDAGGVLRASFGLRGSNTAGLELSDARGGGRVLVQVPPNGAPGLALRDDAGRRRATLDVLADGTPALNLNGEDGRPRAALSLVTGRAALALADRAGAVVWTAP